MLRGLVFNVQKYSVHDGPGIRTTVFLKGCPLRCAWCHNPEGISPRREILVIESRCLACGECRAACPVCGQAPGEGPLPAQNERCTLCGACVAACPTQARQIAGREMSVPEVVDLVMQDQVFYQDSGGGVTFSGGEPLAQPEFLLAALAACHERGVHTVVDTCGLARREDLLAIAPFTDLFLYDLKALDEKKHRQHTGASNQLILENLRALGQLRRPIWVRIPLVPGLNDDPAGLAAAARFIASLPGVCQVNVLPFHRTGLQKAERVGQPSRVAEVQPPTAEAVQNAVAIFQTAGLAAKAGG